MKKLFYKRTIIIVLLEMHTYIHIHCEGDRQQTYLLYNKTVKAYGYRMINKRKKNDIKKKLKIPLNNSLEKK